MIAIRSDVGQSLSPYTKSITVQIYRYKYHIEEIDSSSNVTRADLARYTMAPKFNAFQAFLQMRFMLAIGMPSRLSHDILYSTTSSSL